MNTIPIFARNGGLQNRIFSFCSPHALSLVKGSSSPLTWSIVLDDLPIKLIITHHAEYNSLEYLDQLKAQADSLKVDLHYVPELFQPQRQNIKGKHKIYSLWDAYVYADFVTYPSLYEGFGNALIETMFFHKPFLVNRYAIYIEDIEPTGLQAVSIDGKITDRTVTEVRSLLSDQQLVAKMTSQNARVAAKHFSYQTAQIILEDIIKGFIS